MHKYYGLFFWLWVSLSVAAESQTSTPVTLHVLGVAQDAGYPQLNCYQSHCLPGWQDPQKRKWATALAVIDEQQQQKFLFDATPDIREQMYQLHLLAPDERFDLAGIFLTHGHMGHYTGLMHLGREAAGTQDVPVYVMPRFKAFLQNHGPWSQLVTLQNIQLQDLSAGQASTLTPNLEVTPLLVPHRDEFTETVGFLIKGPSQTALFIPDIDKWSKWDEDIRNWIQRVDFALLDATFFANGEIPNRDMTEIPHPFVTESMALFKDLSPEDKAKIHFIHFNHSNPLIDPHREAADAVRKAGFQVAVRGLKFAL